MIPTTLAEIAAATGGRVDAADPAATITGPVVADSRAATAGSLFVAVPGEHVDGHDFSASAVEAGAVAVLAQRPVGVPAVVVADSVEALGRLAQAMLRRIDPTVVGVTGSSGKTSTKDLLAQVLAQRGPIVAPPGSYNTEIGLPLTVLSADETTRTLVLEMGSRGIGHIAYLCRIAPPDVGVVLNVGSAHVGEFGGREAIARSKGELVEALPEGGAAVLNGDDPLVRQMAERTVARVVMFGESVHSDVRADQITLDDDGRASFRLVTPSGQQHVRLNVVGEHHVSNALATAAVAETLGLSVDDVAAALSAATVRSRWRMEVVERPDGVTVINDAYNANPESMRASLKALAAIGKGRRTWAVLGEMKELGEVSEAEHDALGRFVVRLDVSRLVVVGHGAKAVRLGAVQEGSAGDEAVWVPDGDAALDLLNKQVEPGDVILVKASRAAELDRLAEALVKVEVTGR
ncbi:MAG TPA: UDP-N-acetylmuramoyl-tripeptide--D-alanyl-D-alanine ligase [Jiangellaceae bacterium]|nr:UDP-N-acetylmuramoyl-tripeptide--D-alanyl-D-alanine ligase [Jiangellaceae bacterium]